MSSEELFNQIQELHKQGLSYQKIATQLGLSKAKVQRTINKHQATVFKDAPKVMLEEMTREDRTKYVEFKLKNSPRAKYIFQDLDNTEKQFFLDEYMNIMKSIDSITEAEEQQLFLACVEYVLAYKAQRMQACEQKFYKDTMDGVYDSDAPQYRPQLDDRFTKEYEQHMKRYSDLMKSLKLNRDQRLDKIKSERRNLIDVVSEFITVSSQNLVADEIERLNKLKQEELRKLIENNQLFGEFS